MVSNNDWSWKIADPVISGVAATQFDRYYSHPAFDRLGFHPYRNNEEFYNQNSSGWEDAGRMFGQIGKLMGTGFNSGYIWKTCIWSSTKRNFSKWSYSSFK